MKSSGSRRFFMKMMALGGAAVGLPGSLRAQQEIQGFEQEERTDATSVGWEPVSDRKIRVGLVGYGVCKFAAAFGFQDHPNVEVAAVSDLFPDRRAELAKVTQCELTYPSLEELVKDDTLEAVFVATDAPSHAEHCLQALEHGKHVATAVPAVFGSIEDAYRIMEKVKSTGLKYMMFETSYFHEDLFAMRNLYRQGHLGEVLYSEGEYYHYMPEPIPSYQGWRVGLPPQWYPTHSNAYHIGVTGGCFTEVTCMAKPSEIDHLKASNNEYRNPFGTETALFRTSEGGSARMAVSWDTPGFGAEDGRIRAEKGSYYNEFQGLETEVSLPKRPPLPATVIPGGHGGSHGYLMNDFVLSILEDRKPLVDVAQALNLTVAGIVAHESAQKDGETLKIPQFSL